jgi:hypothetical protein
VASFDVGTFTGKGKTMKALGITAMIFAVIAIFVPLAGPYLTIVDALLAAFAAGPGLTFGVVAILINILNVVFLSPSLWITAGAVGGAAEVALQASNGTDALTGDAVASVLAGMGVIFIGVQVVAVIVLAVVHVIWRGRQKQEMATSR